MSLVLFVGLPEDKVPSRIPLHPTYKFQALSKAFEATKIQR